MKPPITVFIDEAGDPGVRDGLHYSETRHEWLCIAAAVVRSENEPELGEWITEMRRAGKSRQANALHYAQINTARREAVCATLAKKSLRGFCLASHKTNVRAHINPRLGRISRADEFYNWCVRLLFERLCGWYADLCATQKEEMSPAKVVFAERGGHDYQHMFSYFDRLRMQTETKTLHLKGKPIPPQLLVRDEWGVAKAESLPGLQVADTIASAFYQAANANSPSWDTKPAEALKPIMAKDARGTRADAGVTVWPLLHQASLPETSKQIFRTYGYVF